MKMMNLCAAALCVLTVAACADRMNKSSNTAGSDSGYSSSSSSSSTGSGTAAQSMPGTAPGAAGATGMTGTGSATSSQTSYGVVQAIDQLQRQDVGVGVMGAAAAGGMPTDKVYRITVRLDDGSTQMVVLESSPSYKIGDRIRYSNGSVQSY